MERLLAAFLLLSACAPAPAKLTPPPPPKKIVLWAWDRAEDLRFLKPDEAAVAGLLQTMYFRNGKVDVWRRRLPLLLPEGTELIRVTRFESDGSPLPTTEHVEQLYFFERIRKRDPIQFDFDVRASQIPWYRELLERTREWKTPVSITSIVSACIDKPWFQGLPAEAVPMLFRMGPQRHQYLAKLQKQGAFADGCRGTLGISIDEPLPWRPAAETVYIFNPRPWTREAFDLARSQLR